MLHEKPNESSHWKKTLDELDHLPGEATPDKSISWEKLHDRLREKPRRTQITWYWVAAACLLLVLMAGIQWFSVSKNEKAIVTGKTTHIPQQPSNPLDIIQKDSVANRPFVAVKEKTSGSVYLKEKDKPVVIPPVVHHHQGIMEADTSKGLIPPIIVNITESHDTISLVAFIPPKKKLRVVHINELDRTAKEDIPFARTGSFGPTINRPDGLQGFSLSRNASDNIVKIKLPPSN